jgi:hypothetical protein
MPTAEVALPVRHLMFVLATIPSLKIWKMYANLVRAAYGGIPVHQIVIINKWA